MTNGWRPNGWIPACGCSRSYTVAPTSDGGHLPRISRMEPRTVVTEEGYRALLIALEAAEAPRQWTLPDGTVVVDEEY